MTKSYGKEILHHQRIAHYVQKRMRKRSFRRDRHLITHVHFFLLTIITSLSDRLPWTPHPPSWTPTPFLFSPVQPPFQVSTFLTPRGGSSHPRAKRMREQDETWEKQIDKNMRHLKTRTRCSRRGKYEIRLLALGGNPSSHALLNTHTCIFHLQANLCPTPVSLSLSCEIDFLDSLGSQTRASQKKSKSTLSLSHFRPLTRSSFPSFSSHLNSHHIKKITLAFVIGARRGNDEMMSKNINHNVSPKEHKPRIDKKIRKK